MKSAIIHFKDGSTNDTINPLIKIIIDNGFHGYDMQESEESFYHLDNIERIEIVDMPEEQDDE